MPALIRLGTVLFFMASPHILQAHGPIQKSTRVLAELSEGHPSSASLAFRLFRFENHQSVLESSLAGPLGRRLQVLLFDAQLQAVHIDYPEFRDSLWHLKTEKLSPGLYQAWIRGHLDSAHEGFAVRTQIQMKGTVAANPETMSLVQLKENQQAASHQIQLSQDKLISNQELRFSLSISRMDGTKPLLKHIDGQWAIIIALSEDGETLADILPYSVFSDPIKVMAYFPKPGSYRVWIHFQDQGGFQTVPISVAVEKSPSS